MLIARIRAILRRTRDQLARVERLGQIIVGADLQPDDTIDILALGGDHQHRHVADRAQPAAERQPVLPRQHHVEDREIDPPPFVDAVELLRRATADRLEPLACKQAGHERSDFVIVLDDGNQAGAHTADTAPRLLARKGPQASCYTSLPFVILPR